jgi:hypothetical protein
MKVFEQETKLLKEIAYLNLHPIVKRCGMKFNCQMKQTHIEFRDYLTLTRVHQIKNLMRVPGEDFMKAYSINIRK